MGDYSRAAINTSFNTGTLVGVCCNIFGAETPPKYIPAFTWGTKEPKRYELDLALRDIANWKKFKGQTLEDTEIKTIKNIFEKL